MYNFFVAIEFQKNHVSFKSSRITSICLLVRLSDTFLHTDLAMIFKGICLSKHTVYGVSDLSSSLAFFFYGLFCGKG